MDGHVNFKEYYFLSSHILQDYAIAYKIYLMLLMQKIFQDTIYVKLNKQFQMILFQEHHVF